MAVDLFIRGIPDVIKELVSREAFDNRRSINQEAIALLEEALVVRAGSMGRKRSQLEAMLAGYASRAAASVPGPMPANDKLGPA